MINGVEMTNWRAYDHQSFQFEPGITFIMGANGTGKTSILEAIAYALTGEPSTVEDRTKLLKDPSKSAQVRLNFSVEDHEYVVERSQSSVRAEDANLSLSGSEKTIASSHRRVTSEIERLMRVSSDFLQRIIYMAEGDVFRFLRNPPGEALTLQIRQVLGLTQMDQFLAALEMAEKETKNNSAVLQGLTAEIERLRIQEGDDLTRQLVTLNAKRDQLLARLRAIQGEIAQLKRENEVVVRLAPLLRQAQSLSADSDFWQEAQQKPVVQLYENLEQGLIRAQDAVQQNQVEQARLGGEQSTHQKTLDLLLHFAGRTGSLPCPVCGKPMTSSERDKSTQGIQDSLRHIAQELASLSKAQTEHIHERDQNQKRIKSLRDLRDFLSHGAFGSIDGISSIAELARNIESQRTLFQSKLQNLEAQATDVEKQIGRLEEEKSEYLTLDQNLRRLGYESPIQVRESLVAFEARALALRAAGHAAQETLATQQNTDLRSIFKQVAGVWQSFTGQGNWKMELDNDGSPQLQDKLGRKFDLSQFSGGEKTALLIILHTIIAHYFSKCDFLLIDEPLEHLDPINRRSLVRFLVDAYKQGMFKQAIIATFEEALIRKYMAESNVRVIHL